MFDDEIGPDLLVPIKPVNSSLGAPSLYLLRLDQIDALISGNKWFKLKYNLISAKAANISQLVSFGGAFSNHIHALAWAGRRYDFETVGIIRGEPIARENPTLSDASRWGMRLEFVSRAEYRCRYDESYLAQLQQRYPNALILPEGGSNQLAIKGTTEIANLCAIAGKSPDWIVSAVGSGGTLAGLINGASSSTQLMGILVLKGAEGIKQQIKSWLPSCKENEGWQLDAEGHLGGYAKVPQQLLAYIAAFEEINGIQLDPIYTGKMMYRIEQLIQNGTFHHKNSIVAVHTGGLQGCRGMVALK